MQDYPPASAVSPHPQQSLSREAGHGDRSSGGYDDRRSSSSPGGRPGSMSDHWTPPASNGGGYGAPLNNDLDDEIPF